jgi:hypothetical protein
MGEAACHRASRRYRRARRRLRNRRAVVAVIGTLLALLVFFTLFGVFITQYLPLWMTQNEAAFTAQADLAFASFKSTVDSQYQLGGPQTTGVPFTLASGNVPLFAQPTQALLEFLPSGCSGGFVVPPATGTPGQPVNSSACLFVNITMTSGPGGSGLFTQRIPTGVLEMVLPNRYYTPETYFYEDDAVINWQPGGYETMSANPPFNITHTAAGNTTVTTTLLQMYGNATAVVGLGSQDMYSHFRYSQQVTSSGVYVPGNKSYLPFTFTFEIGTQYPCAWWAFLHQTMQATGLASTDWSLTPTTAPSTNACANYAGLTTVLTLTVANVNFAQYYYAGVQVSTGLGGT